MLVVYAESLNGRLRTISEMMVVRLNHQLLGLMIRVIGLLLHMLMAFNLVMMIVSMKILSKVVKRLRMLMIVKVRLWMKRPLAVILEMFSKWKFRLNRIHS